VKVTTPAVRSTEPPAAFDTPVTTSVSPSTSVSLARIAAVTSVGVSSSTSMVSSLATGPSFSQVISTVACADSEPPLPSLMS
jgi:hypothetical protein